DLRARCPSLDTVPEEKCYSYIWMQTQFHGYTGEGHKRYALWQQYDTTITPTVTANSRWHGLLNYWGSGAARQIGDMKAAKARWRALLDLESTKKAAKGDHMSALAIAGALADMGFAAEAAKLAHEAYVQGEQWVPGGFDERLFYAPGLAVTQASAGVDFGAEKRLRELIAKAQQRKVSDPKLKDDSNIDQEAADAEAALALTLIAGHRYDEAIAPIDRAIALHRARPAAYNQFVTQYETHRIALNVLRKPTDVSIRVEAVRALEALRTRAASIPDQASLPRIDALIAAIETNATRANDAWSRARDAMLARDFRPADTSVLLRALNSRFVMPTPVDDAVVADMRARASKILELTGREIALRAK
ncbi:MAG: hypothetical protein ACRDAM_07455, partial [Casimicrobium sp.]